MTFTILQRPRGANDVTAHAARTTANRVLATCRRRRRTSSIYKASTLFPRSPGAHSTDDRARRPLPQLLSLFLLLLFFLSFPTHPTDLFTLITIFLFFATIKLLQKEVKLWRADFFVDPGTPQVVDSIALPIFFFFVMLHWQPVCRACLDCLSHCLSHTTRPRRN